VVGRPAAGALPLILPPRQRGVCWMKTTCSRGAGAVSRPTPPPLVLNPLPAASGEFGLAGLDRAGGRRWRCCDGLGGRCLLLPLGGSFQVTEEEA
jgi:hypothetical protein